MDKVQDRRVLYGVAVEFVSNLRQNKNPDINKNISGI